MFFQRIEKIIDAANHVVAQGGVDRVFLRMMNLARIVAQVLQPQTDERHGRFSALFERVGLTIEHIQDEREVNMVTAEKGYADGH